jgi:hypothetical protein
MNTKKSTSFWRIKVIPYWRTNGRNTQSQVKLSVMATITNPVIPGIKLGKILDQI